ncbi:MAG: serine hydrolase [Rhodanobacteraceae bacterium]|nr:MAG: serine hydrolase [Rhodanobacteraceae bacterium]
MRARWLFPLLLVLSASTAPAAEPQPASAPAELQGLDGYVQQVMDDWHVPGLALAVVKDGKTVLARGYGVRELGKPGKVDADTLFDIGSNTKAFTAAALGTLVASGKLKWDTPVIDELKDFRLVSPYVTQEITLRDLLTHRSGYCDPTSTWYTSDADDIIRRMRWQKPEYGFRTTFCYNNVQYLAASRFIPALTGQGWNDYVAAHLFRPLGMTRTVSTDSAVAASTDVAAPHGMVDGKPEAIHRYWPHNMDLFAAVGGIWSSANDMGHWMQMLLADGKYDGQTVLDPNIIRAMETPQMLIRSGNGVGDEIRAWMPGGAFHTYGLGLFMQDLDGHELVWHAGDIDGMASALVLVPDAQLGIVVLSNMNQANARFAIVARVLQTMLDLPQRDHEPGLLAQAKKDQAEGDAMDRKLAATRLPGAKSSLPLADYAGTYTDKLDGEARVELVHGRMVLRLGNPDFTGDLEPWHGDTFRVTWRYKFYGDDYATFDVDAMGKPAKLSLTEASLHYQRARSPDKSGGTSR